MADKSLKTDQNKNRLDLVEPAFVNTLGWVLTHGATKYAAYDWRKLDNEEGKARVRAALERHWLAYKSGEVYDPETGLPHLLHIGCNTMFLHYFDHHGEMLQSGCTCSVCQPEIKEVDGVNLMFTAEMFDNASVGPADSIKQGLAEAYEYLTHEDALESIEKGDEGEDTGEGLRIENSPSLESEGPDFFGGTPFRSGTNGKLRSSLHGYGVAPHIIGYVLQLESDREALVDSVKIRANDATEARQKARELQRQVNAQANRIRELEETIDENTKYLRKNIRDIEQLTAANYNMAIKLEGNNRLEGDDLRAHEIICSGCEKCNW